ncbi:MAG TPA: zinc-dependent metalloprotease [Saprospiraceae bacterium]|nr:zinc-dependent metalloprotease [Saprospiraceae bacterium]
MRKLISILYFSFSSIWVFSHLAFILKASGQVGYILSILSGMNFWPGFHHAIPSEIQEQKEISFNFQSDQNFTKEPKWISDPDTMHFAYLFVPESDDTARSSGTGFQSYRVDTALLRSLLKQKPEQLRISLPFEGKNLELDLIKNESFIENMKVYHGSHHQNTLFDYQPGVYYQGIKKGSQSFLYSISFFEDDIIGMIVDQEGSIDMGYLEEDGGSKTSTFVVRRSTEIFRELAFECEVLEPPSGTSSPQDADRHSLETRSTTLCFRQYIEASYHLYQNKGSNIAQTVNYLTGLYNQVALLYNNEQINLSISQILVWTQLEPYSSSSSSNALFSFSNAMSGGFNGDLAHLVSMHLALPSGGVAWLNTVCGGSNYYKTAFSKINSTYQNVPTYSWSVMVITHELGHNLGSDHTQACVWNGNNTAIDGCASTEGNCPRPPIPPGGGTIMSYCHSTSVGINFSLGFGPQPGNRIRNVLAGCPNCSNSGNCGITLSGSSSTPVSCQGVLDGTLTVNATCTDCTGLEFSMDGSNFQSSGHFTGLSAGSYTIFVRKSNDHNCISTAFASIGFESTCNCNNNLYTLTLRTDNYGYETSWVIANDQNQVVAQGPAVGVYPNNTTITEYICLPGGCYEFRIFDSWGDGICCEYGHGYYTLTDPLGQVTASGGQFGISEITPFCATSGLCEQEFIHVSSKPPGSTVAAINEITSDWVIASNENPNPISFKAGEKITLLDGFHAMAGTDFQAYIESCAVSTSELPDTLELQQSSVDPENLIVSNKILIHVYPNITYRHTNIEIILNEEDEIQLMIFNQSGQMVHQLLRNEYFKPGVHTFQLNVEPFPAGMYYLTLLSRQDMKTQRFIVLR